MKWLTAADGPVQDWIYVTVDGISYSVHTKRAEIHCEAQDRAELHLLMTNDKHRRNLADRAALAQREFGSWASEKQDSWSVHAGGKKMRVAWDGSLPAEKAAKAAAIAAGVLRSEAGLVTAESMEEMAQRKFNKSYGNLNPQEKAQLADEMHNQQGQAPAAAPVPPSFTPHTPLAPGQSSKSINWFVTADNPDFIEEGADAENPKDQKANDDEPAKKDKPDFPPKKKDDKSDDKSDKKDDKPKDEKKDKDPKKEDKPKEKKAPSKSDEKKDVDMAEDLVKDLEDLIKSEEKEGEGGPHLEALRHALEELKKFMGEEENELMDLGPKGPGTPGMPGIPMKIDMKPMPMKGPMPPPGPGMGAPAMPFASWTEENNTGFREHDSVWRKADMGIVNSVGLEPGRVVAIGNGKVIIDWGDDEVLAEERPEDLVLAQETSGERSLFDESSTISEVNEENYEQSPEEIKAEIEAVLSKTSLKDLLNVTSTPDGSNPNAIVHVGTGMDGVYVAKGSDGRLLVKVAGEEFFVWPYEVRFVNAQEEK